MSDPHIEQDNETEAAEPTVTKQTWPSMVWLIPIVTLLIGGWLVVKTISEKGPEITITFKTAEGIEAGKTRIKYKEIEIGVVDSVHFSKDFSHIIVTAEVAKEAELFLKRDTHFWVVKPSLGLRGASGLGTLLSGAFIEMEPGQGAPQRHFIGLEVPPLVKAEVAGKEIVLLAKRLGSLDRGSPVYYRGMVAGEVLGHELGTDRKSIFIYAFIKAPFDELVQSNSRFWNVSGMDVSLGTEGLNVHMEAVESLIYGGISFETPIEQERVKKNVEEMVFTLYDSYENIQEQTFTKKIVFILFFEGSLRGLNIGAPVEFKGIKVGEVTDVRLEFDREDVSFRIPVIIEIEPERVIERGDGSEESSPLDILQNLVDHGLRATLQTGSFLTGQLYVSLDMYPDTPIRLVGENETIAELPTLPAQGFGEMAESVKGFLAKLEKVKVDRIGYELLQVLQGVNRLANAAQLQDAVDELHVSLKTFRSILEKVDRRVEPIAVNLEQAVKSGHQTLEKVRGTLTIVDDTLKPDSPASYEIIRLSEELAETARSIRSLVDMLERDPNSVIFGKEPPGGK